MNPRTEQRLREMTAAETEKEAARLAAYRANPVNRRAEWGAVVGMIGGTVLTCWLAADGRGAVAAPFLVDGELEMQADVLFGSGQR